jgi:hypothetical protein
MNLKSIVLALTVACAAIPVARAASVDVDKYPTKPIRLIAPFVRAAAPTLPRAPLPRS